MLKSEFEIRFNKKGLLNILEKAGYVMPPVKDESCISVGLITKDKKRHYIGEDEVIEVYKV